MSADSAAAHPVTVTARHTLQCANEGALAKLESPFRLGPFDQLVLPIIPIAVVFVYKNPTLSPSLAGTTSSELIPVTRLQRAITLLLDYYPHLTGRLQINPSDKFHEITRLGTGAELFTAQCSVGLDAFCSPPDAAARDVSAATPGRILLLNLPDGGNALLAPFDPTLEGVCRDPIFTVQHTRFACGGVALGVRLYHTVCDADGFFQLVRDLAEIYRSLLASDEKGSPGSGFGKLARPPHIRSYLSGHMMPEDRRAALDFQPAQFYVEPSGQAAVVAESASRSAADSDSSLWTVSPYQPPVVGRVLRFSSHELAALKAHATDPNGGGWISTFEALSAHICQCVYRARLQLLTAQGMTLSAASSELSPEFLTPVNWRAPDRLNFPPRYFPNALFCSYNTLPHDMIANGPLCQVAKAIHDLMRMMSPEDARQTLRWIAAQPDKSRVKDGFRYAKGSFLVSQWCKFDMYLGVDFDIDMHGEVVSPALVSPPFTPISLVDGLAYFLATEEQLQRATPRPISVVEYQSFAGGGCAIDVNLALSEPLWPILDQDESFRQFAHP